jgi:hypothetical protein
MAFSMLYYKFLFDIKVISETVDSHFKELSLQYDKLCPECDKGCEKEVAIKATDIITKFYADVRLKHFIKLTTSDKDLLSGYRTIEIDILKSWVESIDFLSNYTSEELVLVTDTEGKMDLTKSIKLLEIAMLNRKVREVKQFFN